MAAIRQILCPVDFSDVSVRCVAHAQSLARWRGARLTVLHVESPLVQRLPDAPPESENDQAAHASDLERVRGRVAALFESAGVPMGTAEVIVDLGRPAPHILDRACSLAADVIVLGSHGHGGFERLVLGSVAERVLRRAPCDVLVVPPHAVAPTRLPYESIVCGVDFSASAERALRVASDLAIDAGASLAAVHVIGWPWDESGTPAFDGVSPQQARALEAYKRYLEEGAIAQLQALLSALPALPAQRTPILRHGRSHREILQVARERRADVIVLGVQGRGAMDLAFFGSTASQVVRSAACPVWIARLSRS
jgi:nucleotide-binding universal stress UspA family protein